MSKARKLIDSVIKTGGVIIESGYYDLDNKISIKEVLKRWIDSNEKVTDNSMPKMYKVSEVWPYREYTWTKDKARPGFARIGNKRAEVSGSIKWDLLLADMKQNGWRKDEQPCIIQLGKNGKLKVGEGNHRLAIAKELGIREIPCRFEFHQKVSKDKPKDEPVNISKKTARKVVQKPQGKLNKQDKETVDQIMGILGF